MLPNRRAIFSDRTRMHRCYVQRDSAIQSWLYESKVNEGRHVVKIDVIEELFGGIDIGEDHEVAYDRRREAYKREDYPIIRVLQRFSWRQSSPRVLTGTSNRSSNGVSSWPRAAAGATASRRRQGRWGSRNRGAL